MTGFLHWLFNNVIVPIDPLFSDLTESEDFSSFVHETRYTSSFDGPLQFTGGVFYQSSKYHRQYPPDFMIGMNAALGFDISPDDLIYVSDTHIDIKEKAVFGEVTYDFTDRISLTAGGRWYDTKVDFNTWGDGFANDGPSEVLPAQQAENGFNPKLLLQADVSENANVYASASKGYRIGGLNGNIPDALCANELADLLEQGISKADLEAYNSDSLWSYEVGFKSKLADNRISVNAAVYVIKWDNIQQQNRLPCGFQYVDNAGKAESKGFEVEVLAAPAEGLTFSLGFGYTDSAITDNGGVDTVAVGDKIQGVPNWTFSASGDYVFPLSDDYDGMLRVDFNYYGRSFSSNNEPSAEFQRLRPSWIGLNLRAGILQEQWEVTLFVNNITDDRANLADSRSIAAETPGRQRLVTNRPRTMGIEARMRF